MIFFTLSNILFFLSCQISGVDSVTAYKYTTKHMQNASEAPKKTLLHVFEQIFIAGNVFDT